MDIITEDQAKRIITEMKELCEKLYESDGIIYDKIIDNEINYNNLKYIQNYLNAFF